MSFPRAITSTVTPFVVARDAGAFLDFAVSALDAIERTRVVGGDGLVRHAELDVGDAVLVTADAQSGWAAAPAYLRVFVEDLDAVLARAFACGATPVDAPAVATTGGERVAQIADPVGNIWWLVEEVDQTPASTCSRASAPAASASPRTMASAMARC